MSLVSDSTFFSTTLRIPKSLIPTSSGAALLATLQFSGEIGTVFVALYPFRLMVSDISVISPHTMRRSASLSVSNVIPSLLSTSTPPRADNILWLFW